MNRTIVTTLFSMVLAAGVLADEPVELVAARKDFQQASPHPDEAARVRYLTGLVRLRDKFARANATADWEAVDAEMRRHPVAKDADAKALSSALLGVWTSPRRDTLYRKNGTWGVLPLGEGILHGTWRIEGNQLFVVEPMEHGDHPDTSRYTILLLTEKNLVFTDGKDVFYETRKGK